MKGHTKFALGLLIVGVLSLIIAKVVHTQWQDNKLFSLTDAGSSKGKITIGIDNWIGYFPLCSPVMKRRLYQQGYLLECIEDQGDYEQRLEALNTGSLDMAVATVDSYLINGQKTQYPGTIIAVLDESKGGDALLAWTDKIATLDDLRKNKTAKIAFTPNSPSDYLLKTIAVHFDINHLKQRQNWPVLTRGSEDALQRLLNKDVDAAVLWQPDVSKALAQTGIHLLLSTEQTQQLIVDVLMAGKEMIQNKPDVISLLLTEYFHTLKYYRDNQSELLTDVKELTKLEDKAVKSLLKGVQWQGLTENAHKWFGTVAVNGLPEQELIETIHASIAIFIDYGSITTSPLINNDPYRIISSHFIAEVYQKLGLPNVMVALETHQFTPLTDEQWQNLQHVGKLKIRPVIFASGADHLTLNDKMQLDVAGKTLKHYPNFRILVKGHTSVRGDTSLNKILSQDRADAVARYLRITHDIPAQRMKAIGYGGEQPLTQYPAESRRAYHYRLPRVELILVADKF
ncbi:MAG: phosphate ABC transporter substrate-binding/OmpA family protein [Methylococcales bacterium]|nr:phosphate ABC transporter substrate-binding/OmpA family protein [Methylococcales bacterium]